MLQVNLRSGTTHLFDMEQEGDRREWAKLSAGAEFQRSITGIAVIYEGRQYATPRPQHFRQLRYEHALVTSRDGARITGEKVTIQTDNVRTTFTVWRGQRGSCKVEVERVGRQVHNPTLTKMAAEGVERQSAPRDTPTTTSARPRVIEVGKRRRTG